MRDQNRRAVQREPLARPGEEASLCSLFDSDRTGQLINRLGEFADDMERQTQDSVDNFIRENPKHSEIGRLLLLHSIIVQGMYKSTGGTLVLDEEKLAPRHSAPDRRNWYHLLLNDITAGAKNSAELKRNKLTIVTFNYDQSLEIFLDRCFSSAEIFSDARWRDILSIHHVYGTPSQIPKRLSDPLKFIDDHKDDISLIDSESTESDRQLRKTIQEVVTNSAYVFVLGFRMEPANVDAIGMRNHPSKGDIHCHNFDGNGALERRMQRMGIAKQTIASGTAQSVLHIDTALSQGFLAYAVE